MVLVLFESQLYIASVMFIENRQKKKILCMTCLAVIMMSICEMCIKFKKKNKTKNEKAKKKKSVDALIVHVIRLVGLTLKFLTASLVALKHIQKRLVGQDIMKNNKGL